MGIDLKDPRITFSDRHLAFHQLYLNKIDIAPENLTRIYNHGFTTRAEGIDFGLNIGAVADRELGGSLSVRGDGFGPAQPAGGQPRKTWQKERPVPG